MRSVPGLGRLIGLVDRLLRPDRAAANAADAAAATARDVEHRRRVGRDVDAMTQRHGPSG